MKRLIISMLIFGLVSVVSWPASARPPGRDLPIPVEVVSVREGSVEHALVLIGTVHPTLRATISSEIDGSINRFNVDEGTFVEEGEVICQLDKTLRLIQLEVAKANLEQARSEFSKLETGYREEEIRQRKALLEEEKANLEKLRLKKQRAEDLFNKQMASQEARENSYWEYEESRAQLAGLQADLDLAQTGNRSEDIMAAKAVVAKREAELEEIQYELSETTISAPFSGVIVSKDAEKGEWVQDGDKLAEIICLERVLIHTEVSEKDISKVKLGQSAHMHLDAYPNERFSGRIKQIIPQADLQSRNFPVRIEVDNPKHRLLAGMFARLKIPVKKDENVLLVPKDAVIKTADGEYVFVVNGLQAHKTKVTLGPSKGDLIAVRGQLAVGDKVVVTNNESLRDMAKVVISGQ